ncbi:MAG: hypothetical protein GXO39_08820 [Thermotogae bacterium]|nr:hypothetical protein [Thermotogota bacterium]
MFSRKLGFALGAVMAFLAAVAFIIGRPPHRDPRIYPLVREYAPFKIEKALGGLKILRKDNPDFKEEPDAVNFYPRLQELERQWARTHLKLEEHTLKILDDQGNIRKEIPLKNDSEVQFIHSYYGVK